MEDIRYFGEVCWFCNKSGYGFLSWSKDGVPQTDIFCHFSDINCEGYKTIKKGQPVSFTIGKNNKEQPKATDVTVIK